MMHYTPPYFAPVLTIYLASLACLLATCCADSLKKRIYVPVKLLTSTGFLLIYVFLSGSSGTGLLVAGDGSFDLLLPTLLLFWLGDLFMGLYNRLRRKPFLYLGIFSFLPAHICLLGKFYAIEPGWDIWTLLLPLLCAPALLLLTRLLHLHLGKVRYAAAIYSCFVASIMIKAIRIRLNSPADSLLTGSFLCAGGILFFISDFVLLFLYFCHFRNRATEKAMHVVNLLTYYMAVLFICLGCLL